MKFPLTSIVWCGSSLTTGLLVIVLMGCQKSLDPMIEVSGQTMGTTYQVKVVTNDIEVKGNFMVYSAPYAINRLDCEA